MRVWKIPEKHLELLDLWRARVLRFKIQGFAIIEKLTGVTPISVSKSGDFSFVPPVDTELPPWFTQPSEPYGLVSPKRNTKKGKALWEAWKQAKIEPITTIHLFMLLGIDPCGRFSYGLNEIGGEVYLTDHECWNPENYGYEAVEV